MDITAAMVKELRESTGSGMMDCKKALVACEGNIEKSVAWLREKGLASASARAGRIASEGLVLVNVTDDKNVASVIEINSETDFVAKNEDFRSFVEHCAKLVAETDIADIDTFLNQKWGLPGAETVSDALTQKISVIGENIKIRRFEKVTKANKGAIGAYVHGGGKIAVAVYLECEKECDELDTLAKDVAMQVAAMNPRFICSDYMGQDFIDSERQIYLNQAKQDPKMSGKPDNVIEKIVEGKLQKQFKEYCLIDQEFIKGDGESVREHVVKLEKALGDVPIRIKSMIRYAVGEGIEKKVENFADEVAKAMQ